MWKIVSLSLLASGNSGIGIALGRLNRIHFIEMGKAFIILRTHFLLQQKVKEREDDLKDKS